MSERSMRGSDSCCQVPLWSIEFVSAQELALRSKQGRSWRNWRLAGQNVSFFRNDPGSQTTTSRLYPALLQLAAGAHDMKFMLDSGCVRLFEATIHPL
jgi:hypothetical protein